jgi:hypothetical protein
MIENLGTRMNKDEQMEETEQEEPQWFVKLQELAKPEWLELFQNPEGGALLSNLLPAELPPDRVSVRGSNEYKVWELIGLYFRSRQRWHDAIAIYMAMYYHFIKYQLESGNRVHKGMPLVWIADCYLFLGNLPLSKRYLMLTLIEDAITMGGNVNPVKTGSYFRLAWRHGVPDIELKRYATEAYEIANKEPSNVAFPEFVLQELDKNWIAEIPSPNDVNIYVTNTIYVDFLLRQLGEPSGKILERLADYVLSCVPGCRTARRKKSYSTDYDIVCSLEGPDVDFRTDFGRYFVCECKDWNKPADFTTFAKFTRVLDSMKARFGVIFSKNGITGAGSTTDAIREQLKVFQDRGMVIIVIDIDDLEFIAHSGNLVSLMREKYESVRLDLRD